MPSLCILSYLSFSFFLHFVGRYLFLLVHVLYGWLVHTLIRILYSAACLTGLTTLPESLRRYVVYIDPPKNDTFGPSIDENAGANLDSIPSR